VRRESDLTRSRLSRRGLQELTQDSRRDLLADRVVGLNPFVESVVSVVIDGVGVGFIAFACPTIEPTTAEQLNAAVRIVARIHPCQRGTDLTRLRAMAATLVAEDR
jgi:hypothetical protein